MLCDAFARGRRARSRSSPRRILQRQLERLAERGLRAKMGSELEFFLLRDDYAAAHAKGYRNLVPTQHYVEDYHILSSTRVEDVIGAIRAHVDASGDRRSSSARASGGPGQHEINLRYAEALEMADRHVIYKLAAKEIAARAGRALTFMAKFDESLAGSSLHVHASLWTEADEPAFAGARALAGAPVTSSDAFRHFLGGLLAHAREVALLFAPNPNSYKRYRAGTFAPTRIAWSYDNRTAGFRVVGDGRVAARRVPDPGRRRQSLSRLRGAARRGARRARERDRAGSGLRGRRLRLRGPAPGADARCPRPRARSRRARSRNARSATP